LSKSFRLSPKYLAVIKVLPFVVIMSVLFIGCIDFGNGKKPLQPVAPAPAPTWSADVSPLFNKRCTPCHISQSQAGLNLSTYQSATSNERIIKPGSPDNSDLVKRIEGSIQPSMPYDGTSLSAEQIKLIRDWIADGAQNN